MTVQIVEIAGQKMAILPQSDYERLLDIAEDRADGAAAEAAEARRADGEEYLPAELVDRIMAGESALKIWRQHRGLTQRDLASAAGRVGHVMISQLESGTREGPIGTWQALASALRVSIEDILPA